MALVNRSFSVNVTPGMMPPIVHVSEYDVGRAYTVSILDEQGNTFTIPSGTTASIEGTLNGAVGFTQSATVSNNQVSFTLSQSMTAYSGKAWCKIKLTLNSEPIQTCAFVLAVDRAGVEANTVIGAPGFEEQIQTAVDNYLDEHPVSGEGWTDEMKTALLACFQNVAWINDQGQTYYDALYAALCPEAPPAPSEWDFDWDYTMGDPANHGFEYATQPGEGTSPSVSFVSGLGLRLYAGNASATFNPQTVFAADKGIAELLFSCTAISNYYQGLAMSFAKGLRLKVYNGKMVANYTSENTESAAVFVANVSASTDYLLRVEWDRNSGAKVFLNGNEVLSVTTALTATISKTVITATNYSDIIIKAYRMKEVS